MKSSKWLAAWAAIVISVFAVVSLLVYDVDPFVHFHAPKTGKYYYSLNNQRSQNDGIIRHFEYDGMLVGTSMTECFKTSDAERLFGGKFVKICLSGASFEETAQNIDRAFRRNKDLKVVIRGIDMVKFFDDAHTMRTDLGVYPTYLYDENPFNDIEYLLNGDVINRSYDMKFSKTGTPGITSFDDYSNYQASSTFGINAVCPGGPTVYEPVEEAHLTDEEKEIIRKNIEMNVIRPALEHPDAEFYLFIPPYSLVWWNDTKCQGNMIRQFEANEYVAGLLTGYENIRLFSFNDRTDVTGDINNYMDLTHYAEWVNTMILEWIATGEGELTAENYSERLSREREILYDYDYASLADQPDYEDDLEAARILGY